MISRCNEIVISRKKFSEFDLYDPTTQEECAGLYLAGYIEDEFGNKQNVKLKASSFINASMGATITDLNPDILSDIVSVDNEVLNSRNISVTTINYTDTNFIQINKISDKLFSKVRDKNYFCLRLSPNIPVGTVIRLYLPNFKKDAGLMIFPYVHKLPSDDNSREVFYNNTYNELSQEESDYYITIIQLADPQNTSGTDIQYMSKVIEVNNITNEID